MRNAFEGASQFRLPKIFVPVEKGATFQKNTIGFRELRKGIGACFERTHLRIGNRKTGGSELNSRLQQFRPRFRAVLLESEVEPANASGHARSAPTEQTVFAWVSTRVQIHVVSGFAWSFLSEVDKGRASIHHADEHKAAPSQVSGKGMRHGQRKADGDRGIHRVPAGFQNRHSHIGSQWFLRDHHPFARVNRFVRIRWRRHKAKSQRTR